MPRISHTRGLFQYFHLTIGFSGLWEGRWEEVDFCIGVACALQDEYPVIPISQILIVVSISAGRNHTRATKENVSSNHRTHICPDCRGGDDSWVLLVSISSKLL